MIEAFKNLFFFNNDWTVPIEKIINALNRDKFDKYLPYYYYDFQEDMYHNYDGSAGFIFECTPFTYASQEIFEEIESLFANLPEGSVLQFMLYASDKIDPFLEKFKKNKIRSGIEIKNLFKEHSDFLSQLPSKMQKVFDKSEWLTIEEKVETFLNKINSETDLNKVQDTLLEDGKPFYSFILNSKKLEALRNENPDFFKNFNRILELAVLLDKYLESMVNFYNEGAKGLTSMNNIPARRFRLFISFKFPASFTDEGRMREIKSMFFNTLNINFNPRYLDPDHLINLLAEILNSSKSYKPFEYDITRPINKQILTSSVRQKEWDTINIDHKKYFSCVSLKSTPSKVDSRINNLLIGGYEGLRSDSLQIDVPFIFRVNFVAYSKKINNYIARMCKIVLAQQAAGTPGIRYRQEEYLQALNDIEDGKPFVYIIPFIWLLTLKQRNRHSLY